MMDSKHFDEFPVIDDFSLGAWQFSKPEKRSGLDHLSKTLQVIVVPLSASTTAVATSADVADLFKDIGEGFTESFGWSDTSSPYSFRGVCEHLKRGLFLPIQPYNPIGRQAKGRRSLSSARR